MYKQKSYTCDNFGHLILAFIWQVASGLTFLLLPLCQLANCSNTLRAKVLSKKNFGFFIKSGLLVVLTYNYIKL